MRSLLRSGRFVLENQSRVTYPLWQKDFTRAGDWDWMQFKSGEKRIVRPVNIWVRFPAILISWIVFTDEIQAQG